MSTRTYPVRGIVLRGRALGEKDRVLVVLTEDRGKLSVVARGARSPKSKLAAASQPFTLARFLLARGRSLDVVSQVEVEVAHTHLAIDLEKSAWATYCCELADVIPEELPEEELFTILAAALAALDRSTSHVQSEIVGRWFEARYLQLLGYAPTIGRCVQCGEKIAVASAEMEQKVLFSASSGGTLCATCAVRVAAKLPLRVQSLRALHQLCRAAEPPDVEIFQERFPLTSAAARDLRDALQQSIFAHLGVRIKSLAFLEEVLAAARAKH
jgi:DNA repair protein RecO (recombination protein O)